MSFEYRELTIDEAYIILKNVLSYDRDFQRYKDSKSICQNPFCGYPLERTDFRVYAYGDVCHLCYDMHEAFSGNPNHWRKLHDDWEAEENRKKGLGGL